MLEGSIYFNSTREELYRQTGSASLNKAIAALMEMQNRGSAFMERVSA